MGLLTPLFLLGLGMVALPLWLHRLQTQTPEREPFSSAMLLEESEQRVHLRKKLRFLVLLSLRILLLALLAIAFAKPVLERTTEVFSNDEISFHFIVMDTSFSMAGAQRFDEAVAVADSIIDDMEPGQQAQVIAADNHIRLVSEAGSNKGELKKALNAVSVGESRLDYGKLMTDLNGLIGDYNHNIAIHLISDFQASGLPTRFADLIPDPGNNRPVVINLHPVTGSGMANWAIDSVRPEGGQISVGIRGMDTVGQEKDLNLKVNGEPVARQSVQVPESGQASVKFEMPELAAGPNRIEVDMGPEDELPGDDRRFLVIENTPRVPVLLLTADPSSLALRYLTTALETGNYTVETVNLAELDPRVLPRYPWLVVDDLGSLNAGRAAELSDYITSGGAIFTALGERTQGRDLLPVSGHSLQRSGWSGKSEFRNVARIDTSHPVLANSPGWRSINISRVISPVTDEADRVLITLEGGDPLLLERQIGAGRLLMLTTSLDNTWCDLPIHSVFVSFMAETARYLANEDILETQYNIGDSILLKQVGSASGQVIDPQGNTVLTLEDTHSTQHVVLNQTGFYEVYTPGRETLLAVNPDPRESDLNPIDAEMMSQWSDAGRQTPVTGENLRVEIEPETLELWHVLLILLLLIVLAESVLGNRYLDYRTGQ